MEKTSNDQISRALKLTEDRIEIVYDIIPTPDYVEIIGSIGGDAVTYRVYDDGSVYAK